MTAPTYQRVSASWLALREPADAAARAAGLVDLLRGRLPEGRPLTVHDLGCGTGSMLRWLAPQLRRPQHWVLHDGDADLLALTRAEAAQPAGGGPVTTEPRRDDVTRLGPGDLAGADLITASALLDLLTAEELTRLVAACTAAGCPMLLTLSVIGRVQLDPPHLLDAVVRDAFNAHQRRPVGGRRLLGPDAAGFAVGALAARGATVVTRPSVWRLGPASAELATEWLAGWLAAACEQSPELAPATRDYAEGRLAQAAAGRLRVLVHHRDLLAWSPRGGAS